MRPGRCLLLLALLPGCAAVPLRQSARAPQPELPPARAVVFVLDGVGNFGATSEAIQRAAEECALPVYVESFEWSHGYGRVLADHFDRGHARDEARRLATQVLCYQQPRPEGPPLPVSILAHSGGCAVALAAAELLPPNSVERIILLSPSVSAEYDLRPALLAARQGIDVFHSRRDAFLGVATAVLGTADRRWTAAAGRVGFDAPDAAAPGASLYLKLRQYPWHDCVAWTGNNGGHAGTVRSRFVRAYVMPLLVPPG